MKSPKYSAEEITASAWMAILDAKRVESIVEKGFETVRDIAKLTGGSEVTVRKKIADLRKRGKVEQRFYTVKDSVGRMLPTPFYRIK